MYLQGCRGLQGNIHQGSWGGPLSRYERPAAVTHMCGAVRIKPELCIGWTAGHGNTLILKVQAGLLITMHCMV